MIQTIANFIWKLRVWWAANNPFHTLEQQIDALLSMRSRKRQIDMVRTIGKERSQANEAKST